MSAFRFRLQRVLELKTRQEHELAETLARALDRASAASDAQKSLDAVRQASAEQFSAAHGGGVTAGQMQNIGFLIEWIDEHLSHASTLVSDAATQAESAREDLLIAHQARRTLDRLRDRRLEEWSVAASRHDQKTTDEFALTQFAMNNSPLHSDR
ncbi:MAG: flagellar export protein FliJ [bacterium]